MIWWTIPLAVIGLVFLGLSARVGWLCENRYTLAGTTGKKYEQGRRLWLFYLLLGSVAFVFAFGFLLVSLRQENDNYVRDCHARGGAIYQDAGCFKPGSRINI